MVHIRQTLGDLSVKLFITLIMWFVIPFRIFIQRVRDFFRKLRKYQALKLMN